MLDIQNFLDRNFTDVLTSQKGELRVDCPFCNDSKHHMYIDSDQSHPVYHCFKCDAKGNWFSLVMNMTGMTYIQALGELYAKPRMVNFEGITSGKQVKLSQVVTLPDGFHNLMDGTDEARLMRNYLHKRGFGVYHIDRYNIGHSSEHPARIIIPIEGEYWQGRRLYDYMRPKYLNPDVPADNVIFNATALEMFDEVVVCEGAFSAMTIGDNGIALIGKACPPPKFERLASAKTSKYVLAVEPEAHKIMTELANKLYKAGKQVECWYYDGDPNENVGIIKKDWNLRTQVEAML
jgi:hypothetical protein